MIYQKEELHGEERLKYINYKNLNILIIEKINGINNKCLNNIKD